MQFVIWTGIVVLGLITLSSAGMVFFHIVGELRRGAEPAEPARPQRRSPLRRVDLEAFREDRPPMRRAA